MINVSRYFRKKLYDNERNYINRLDITLSDGTSLDITNEHIMGRGIEVDDAVGDDSNFNALGATVCNSLKITLYNNDEIYSNYIFENATCVYYTALEVDNGSSVYPEEIKKGTFTVDTATYSDYTITLTLLDFMEQFDRPYSESQLVYPATLGEIVRDACSICLGSATELATQQFPHYNYTISDAPKKDSTTFREVLSWCATIAGCFARCNVNGKLELKWFDTATLENRDNEYDGGIFDGIKSVSWLSDYINTETGMTTLSDTRQDDRWFSFPNTQEFEFNSNISSSIYIDSDSCIAFTDSPPSGHGHSSLQAINICTRDGQSVSIKYQYITIEEQKVTKLRFHGYTRYDTASQTSEYELEYEIFLINNDSILINFITLPTNSGYLGTSTIVENSVSYAFTPTVDNLILMKREDNGWFSKIPSDAYETGDNLEGGSFNPWNEGTAYDGGLFTNNLPIHYITNLYTQDIGVDDIVITGVKIIIEATDTSTDDTSNIFLEGTDNYVVEISNNPFITLTNVAEIKQWLGVQLIGLTFRQCNVSHLDDPTIEAGDIGLIWDSKNIEHPILITRVTFVPGLTQTVVCGAESLSKNQSTRITSQTKAYASLRKQLKVQKNTYDLAIQNLQNEIDNASGLFVTQVTETGGATKYYYHNKPDLEDSDIQMLISSAGITVTANGTASQPTWYGLQVDGTLIASIMNTIGINFDWGTGGTLTLGGQNNGNGVLRVLDANGNVISTLDNTGANIRGNIRLGGSNNNLGTLQVLGTDNTTINTVIDHNGISHYDTSSIIPYHYRTFHYEYEIDGDLFNGGSTTPYTFQQNKYFSSDFGMPYIPEWEDMNGNIDSMQLSLSIVNIESPGSPSNSVAYVLGTFGVSGVLYAGRLEPYVALSVECSYITLVFNNLRPRYIAPTSITIAIDLTY